MGEQIDKMIKEAEQFADEDKKVKERVDAKNAFDGYIHSMRSATEGSGENKGLSVRWIRRRRRKLWMPSRTASPGWTRIRRRTPRRSRKSTRRWKASAPRSFRSTTARVAVVAWVVMAARRTRRKRMMSCERLHGVDLFHVLYRST